MTVANGRDSQCRLDGTAWEAPATPQQHGYVIFLPFASFQTVDGDVRCVCEQAVVILGGNPMTPLDGQVDAKPTARLGVLGPHPRCSWQTARMPGHT
jgi:hypothetical protein